MSSQIFTTNVNTYLMVSGLLMVIIIYACVVDHVDRPQAAVKREELDVLVEDGQAGEVLV